LPTVVGVFDDFALSAGSSRPHGQSPHGLLSGTASGAADDANRGRAGGSPR
jgi:hypothetical protein